MRRRRVNPSTTATGVGPNNLWGREAIRAVGTEGIGIVATALWLIKRDGELRNLAAPEHDQGAIELDVREAVELGRSRAQSSAEARLRAAGNSGKTKD